MAYIAGVRNLQSVSRRRSHKVKRVAPYVHVGDCLLDLRHVAGDALAALASRFVMRVFFYRRGVRAIRRTWAMAIQA